MDPGLEGWEFIVWRKQTLFVRSWDVGKTSNFLLIIPSHVFVVVPPLISLFQLPLSLSRLSCFHEH